MQRGTSADFGKDRNEGRPKGPAEAGIGDALWHAQKKLQILSVKRVLLIGADSLLDAATIRYFLTQERLLSADNACGFIPGEAAAALLLGPHAGRLA